MITHFLSPENIQKFLSLCPGGLAIIGVTWPRFTSRSIAARYGFRVSCRRRHSGEREIGRFGMSVNSPVLTVPAFPLSMNNTTLH